MQEKDRAMQQKDQAMQLKDQAMQEKDQAVQEKDRAVQMHRAMQMELDLKNQEIERLRQQVKNLVAFNNSHQPSSQPYGE